MRMEETGEEMGSVFMILLNEPGGAADSRLPSGKQSVAAPFKNHSSLDLLQDMSNYLRNRPANLGIFGRDFDTGLAGLIGGNTSRRSAVVKRAYIRVIICTFTVTQSHAFSGRKFSTFCRNSFELCVNIVGVQLVQNQTPPSAS